MKSAGTNADLWFATINGNSGFVNSKFIREYKILEKNLHVVPYEAKNQANVQPDKVQQPHEVFEGTTIYTTEAAVNAAQQDSSTQSPLSSNEDLTPSLHSATETSNKNVVNNIPKAPSQDNKEEKENSESQPEEIVKSDSSNNVEHSTTPPKMSGNGSDLPGDENQSVESSTETISKTAEEISFQNSEKSELVESQVKPEEVPKEIPSETLPLQQIITSAGGALNSESVIKVPEKQDYLQNTFTETEQTDSKEQNTSTLNNNVEDVQLSQDTSSEINNMPNGNSLDESVENPTDNTTGIPTFESEKNSMSEPLPIENETVPPINEPVVPLLEEPVANPTNDPKVPLKKEPVPPLNEPVVGQIQQLIPPMFTNINKDNQHNVPRNVHKESNTGTPDELSSSTSEPFPTIAPLPAPSTELPAVQSENLPPTTETIPPLYSEEVKTVPTIETIPPIMNIEAPPTTEMPVQELPPLYTYTTTPVPYSADETNSHYSTSESTPTEDTYSPSLVDVEDIITALPNSPEDINSASTEAPIHNENTEGFFSNMYSSVADIWPSSTEPPEPLYNTEYSTYETEKADGDIGFSFMKYVLSTYYSIMGTSEETKALFASVGK